MLGLVLIPGHTNEELHLRRPYGPRCSVPLALDDDPVPSWALGDDIRRAITSPACHPNICETVSDEEAFDQVLELGPRHHISGR